MPCLPRKSTRARNWTVRENKKGKKRERNEERKQRGERKNERKKKHCIIK